ncbi:HAMP domain-containing sensor histidine kinase [Alteromonas sp. C1M14]|uniref:sensor histidine kinase n=1 Tax=Alteromonas sp. C1M14 TaxID=2841567 RepID=UPI001C093F24|nr:HAMP domain-containing sensor histidine kinase [Alteromonas sp. C1M14]MBU2976601.1 HAMP domain-containing histidine kinase [Alteromonas sp. C1M14]
MHFIQKYRSINLPKLLWLFLINFALSALAGLMVYQWQYNTYMRELANEHATVISNVNSAFSQAMGDMTNIARITNDTLIHNLTSRGIENPSQVFLSTGRSLNNLSQIRWLSIDGQEKIRVNFLSTSSQIVPPSKLQNKADRYYYQEAIASPQGIITLSPIDLNIENGEIVRPYQPTIRTVIHAFPSHPLGEGLLILNFDLGGLLKQLQLFEKTHTDLLLASGETQWLIHPDPSKQWGANLNRQLKAPLTDIPILKKKLFSQNATSLFIAEDGAIYSATKLNLRMKHTHSMQPYTIITRTPDYYRSYIINQSLLPSIITAFLVFCMVGTLLRHHIQQQIALTALNAELAKEKDSFLALMDDDLKQQDPVQLKMNHRVLSFFVAINKEVGTCLNEMQYQLSQMEENINLLALSTSQPDRQTTAPPIDWHANHGLLRYCFQQINSTSTRLGHLASNLEKQHVENFSLKSIMVDLIATLAPLARSRGIGLRENIPESIILHNYPLLYSQLFELLLNALIRHDFEKSTDGYIDISAKTLNNNLIICVQDDGDRCFERINAALFKPFHKDSIKTHTFGIGLYIARHWVTVLLDGDIKVDSTQNHGNQLTITIPFRHA